MKAERAWDTPSGSLEKKEKELREREETEERCYLSHGLLLAACWYTLVHHSVVHSVVPGAERINRRLQCVWVRNIRTLFARSKRHKNLSCNIGSDNPLDIYRVCFMVYPWHSVRARVHAKRFAQPFQVQIYSSLSLSLSFSPHPCTWSSERSYERNLQKKNTIK